MRTLASIIALMGTLALPMSEHTLSVVKHTKGAFYDGIGHAPFYEATDRYNADLAAFVRSVPR